MSPYETQSALIDYVPFFEDLIKRQHKAIASFKKLTVGCVLTGVMIIVFALILNTRLQGVASQIIAIGGVFIGALATFPYKEIDTRHSRIITYELLKKGFEKFSNLSDEDRKRLRDLADETIKKQI
jgi:hypothetical protein